MDEQPEVKEQIATEIDNTKIEVKPVEETQDIINERNWKKFREGRELDRKQKEAAEKLAFDKSREAEALKAAMDALLNKPNQQQQSYESEELSEDERIERKVTEKLEARERRLEQERRDREKAEFPQKLAQAYNDFDQVCSAENLDYLEYHYPEVAAPFKYMPDGFEKWSSVYKAVKRFVTNTNSRKDEVKAEKNFNKPQSMAVGGVTQTGDSAPVQLDEKRRDDNWRRMQRIMKGGR